MLEVQQEAQDAQDQTLVLQDRISHNADSMEREKRETRELVHRVKLYLTDDLVPPEDIDRISRVVLSIQLPGSVDQVQNVIQLIQTLLQSPAGSPPPPQDLQDQSQAAGQLLVAAGRVRTRAEDLDLRQTLQDLYRAEHLQDQAHDRLEAASRHRDRSSALVQQTDSRLQQLDSRFQKVLQVLLMDVDVLEKKTEVNKETARNARAAAEEALANATDTHSNLDSVMKQFEDLKQKRQKQEEENEAAQRVKKILLEAQILKSQVEQQLTELAGLEKLISAQAERKKQKAAEASELLDTVQMLRLQIWTLAERYAVCTA